MAPGSSPCAACKFLRRKCTTDCILAPYFPPDQTQKFIDIHRVYGTSNFQKLLAELPVDQRQDAVNSLAYHAEARRLDPVYGCVGPIVFLQHRVKNLQGVLQDAYKELAAYQDAVLQTEQAMGVDGFPAAQRTADMMHPVGVNPLLSSSSSDPYKMASMMGIPTSGSSLEIREPGPQSNNNNTFHPEELFMPTATVGADQQQEIIRAFEVQQHRQDIRFDRGRGLDVGAGSSGGVGVVGFSLNHPGPQSNNNNNALHPEQLCMPIATIGTEQQETIRAFELQQHGHDICFDGGRDFDVGTGSSSGVGVVGFSLNDPGPQSSNNNNTVHPEQLFMPIATIGTELQETIRAFELMQHGQDISFHGGRGFNVGAGSSTGVGVVGFSLNKPGPQSNNNNNALHPEQQCMPIATVGTEQQETISAFELQQHGLDIRFDEGQGFDVGTGSHSGVQVVGFSLNDPGPQSNNNNNALNPEQLFMPTATVGTEQQEIIRPFEVHQHGKDIRFDEGRGFDVETGSSSGFGVIGSSLNDPGTQSYKNNNALHPEQISMPITTIGTEQQETIWDYELPQHGPDIRFDRGRGFDVGTGSSSGVGDVGFSLNDLGPQSNNNNNALNPEQLFMPTATVGMEQQQEINRAFEVQQHGQGIRFDESHGFDVGTGSSSGVRVVEFRLNDPGPQSYNNNDALHPGQLFMPTATVGTEQQQETIKAFELQQHGLDIRFDEGQGIDVGTGSHSGVGVVGFSLNDPGPQINNNNNNALNPEQLFMPTATVGTEQQEIIRPFEVQQHGQDIRFEEGQGFDVGTGSSSGFGVVGFSLNDPSRQSYNNNNALHPEQISMPITTIGTEQQETIWDYELPQPGPDIRFDRGRGFDVGTGSSSGVGVEGFSLNDPGPQSHNNNAFNPEQLFMPIATVGTEQQQEIIRAFEVPQHEQDFSFDEGRGFDVGTGSSSGAGVVGFSLNDPGQQSYKNNNALHPEQISMPITTIGTEQQETIWDYELPQPGPDIRFDRGRGFDVGTGSSSGVGVEGFSLNDLGPQSDNNNNAFNPEQLFMPTATVVTEQQQEIIRAFEVPQHEQDFSFDEGRGFDVGTGSSSGAGVVGFSLNDPGQQSYKNNNALHPEQISLPITTIGTEQQETIWDYELPQHGPDIRFDRGRGFDVGTGSSTGVGVVAFSLEDPPSPLQASPYPMMGSFESGFSHPHFQPQLSLQAQQAVAVQEQHTQELESQEERLQRLNVGNGESEISSSFYYVNL